MDHKRYPELMVHYNELGTFSIDPRETKESLLKKLTDISREKKQILTEANAIIKEYITKYEEEPDLLDSEAAAILEEFLAGLRPSTHEPLDPSISLRISRLLQYYQADPEPEQMLRILLECGIYDLILKDHISDYTSSVYAVMAEQYMNDFDRLSKEGKDRLLHCVTIGGYNLKDLTYGLKK